MVIRETGKKLGLNLSIQSSISAEEELLLRRAARHIVECVNSEDFETFVLNYKYEYTVTTGSLWWKKYYKKCHEGFNWNDGKSNKDIYDSIMSGAESLREEVDNEIDIDLVVDRRNKRGVVGYTYPNSIKQWVYSWVLRTDHYKVSGNLVHEWCHKLGYGHTYRYNSTREYTVPYAIGRYVSNWKRE